MKRRVLIVQAPYYQHIVDPLRAGALRVLEAANCEVDVINVPGAFEIPAAIRWAEAGRDFGEEPGYDGYVALGCVIRGETSHYDYVCGECARAIMDLTVQDKLAIGFGVLTVENEAQAIVRADQTRKDKGGEAARAVLAMMELRDVFGLDDVYDEDA